MNEEEIKNKVLDELEYKQIEEEVSTLSEDEIEKLRNEAKPYTDKDMEYIDVQLDAKGLQEKYILLRKLEIDKAYNEIALGEMYDQVEIKLPARLLQDTIDKMEKDISEGMITKKKDNFETREKATEAELDMMKIKVKYLKQEAQQNLPMKNLRNQISNFKMQLGSDESPDKNIPKLRKAIRTKKETVLASRFQQQAGPRNYVG